MKSATNTVKKSVVIVSLMLFGIFITVVIAAHTYEYTFSSFYGGREHHCSNFDISLGLTGPNGEKIKLCIGSIGVTG